MNRMHLGQNILRRKALTKVVLRSYCKTYRTQGQIKTAAYGSKQRFRCPLPLGWGPERILVGQHPSLEPARKTTIVLFQGRSAFALWFLLESFWTPKPGSTEFPWYFSCWSRASQELPLLAVSHRKKHTLTTGFVILVKLRCLPAASSA